MLKTFGACPIEIMPLEIIADKFQLSKCNARIHTGFLYWGRWGGGGGGGGVVEADIGGGSKDGGLKDVNFEKFLTFLSNSCIRF